MSDDFSVTIGFNTGYTKCRRCAKIIGYNSIKSASLFCTDCKDKDDMPSIIMCSSCDSENISYEDEKRKDGSVVTWMKCDDCNTMYPTKFKRAKNGEPDKPYEIRNSVRGC